MHIATILPDLSLQFNGITIKSGSYTIPATKLLTVELRNPSDAAGNGNKVSYKLPHQRQAYILLITKHTPHHPKLRH